MTSELIASSPVKVIIGSDCLEPQPSGSYTAPGFFSRSFLLTRGKSCFLSISTVFCKPSAISGSG